MQNFLTKITATLLLPVLAFGSLFTPHVDKPIPLDSVRLDAAIVELHNMESRVSALENSPISLGATNALPTAVALFETSLASKISPTATSMTLVSALDKTGTALASSTYGFILDEGTPVEEMVLADCTATACRNMVRGISPITGTSTVVALEHEHRRGASVKITSGPQLLIISEILNGMKGVPGTLFYTNEPSGAQWSGLPGTTLVTLNKLNGTAFGSTPVGVSVGGTGQTSFPNNVIMGTNSSGSQLIATGTPQLDVGFIHATSTGYTATSTFASDVKLTTGVLSVASTSPTATSTFSGPLANMATTSIACGANTNLILNGLDYVCPSSRGVQGSKLTEDGFGNLSWAGDSGKAFGTSTTQVSINSTTASTTVFKLTVPGNTLSTGNFIDMDIPVTAFAHNAVAQVWFDTAYGTGSTTQAIAGITNLTGQTGFIRIILQGNGTTNSQKLTFSFIAMPTGSFAAADAIGLSVSKTTTIAIDSTADRILMLVMRFNVADTAHAIIIDQMVGHIGQ